MSGARATRGQNVPGGAELERRLRGQPRLRRGCAARAAPAPAQGNPTTATGTVEQVSPLIGPPQICGATWLFPSSPTSLRPQHTMPPVAGVAQAISLPAD